MTLTKIGTLVLQVEAWGMRLTTFDGSLGWIIKNKL
jgi:hypothetical protein